MAQSPAKAARRTVKRAKARAQSRFGHESVLPQTRDLVGELVDLLNKHQPKEHGGLWHRYEAVHYAVKGTVNPLRDVDKEPGDEDATRPPQ